MKTAEAFEGALLYFGGFRRKLSLVDHVGRDGVVAEPHDPVPQGEELGSERMCESGVHEGLLCCRCNYFLIIA